MLCAGIDIGSRTIKLVVSNEGRIVRSDRRETTFDPLAVCRDLLGSGSYDRVAATGYGRHLLESRCGCAVLSEIKAVAMGARFINANCHTILDIGGQDVKAISLDAGGRVRRFEMNDRCAAGSGRFLEIMAIALGLTLSEFGDVALSADGSDKINSMCTVFAESEVISLAARGARKSSVALGIHKAIADRCTAMLRRLPIVDDVMLVGGVALNPCMPKLIGEAIGRNVITPENPQMVAALGCLLAAGEPDDELSRSHFGHALTPAPRMD